MAGPRGGHDPACHGHGHRRRAAEATGATVTAVPGAD
ncbi:hypothetical protein SACE_5938 [Saccharopolyspora erythraea NRRL 2338]|uniref:Uncharacterized protein n=1 Tax=Saccharopolyspora erythraea (strain ATCC 11635 / DSM 40517 / JCM 4748 / NBRC 13426 / NCIMB 8594 / NRRL 2338) TaxID=405948 RepID=A4FM46_SACEN|nr:hypothetical protein N599_19145 [Saccharopolyspora erythraea D]CAM05121.1 hypothetical protein SACE_5938 [Saccharopolyspora erythraea NRRL 2338]